MMRRKNTRRRVQALSSDSIRSDEIAATEMALSRDGSRDGVSDMARAVHDRDLLFIALNSWALAAAKSIRTPEMAGKRFKLCRRSRPSVTQAIQGVRIGTGL